jgi:hypothetical protein
VVLLDCTTSRGLTGNTLVGRDAIQRHVVRLRASQHRQLRSACSTTSSATAMASKVEGFYNTGSARPKL